MTPKSQDKENKHSTGCVIDTSSTSCGMFWVSLRIDWTSRLYTDTCLWKLWLFIRLSSLLWRYLIWTHPLDPFDHHRYKAFNMFLCFLQLTDKQNWRFYNEKMRELKDLNHFLLCRIGSEGRSQGCSHHWGFTGHVLCNLSGIWG